MLAGKAGAYRDIVLLNAAAALIVAEKAKDLKAGVALAADVWDGYTAERDLYPPHKHRNHRWAMAQGQRSQLRNREEALARLIELIRYAPAMFALVLFSNSLYFAGLVVPGLIDLHVHFRSPLPIPDGMLLGRFRCTHVRDGFFAWPDSLTLDNYRNAWEQGDILRKYWNTALILVPSIFLTLFFSVIASTKDSEALYSRSS